MSDYVNEVYSNDCVHNSLRKYFVILAWKFLCFDLGLLYIAFSLSTCSQKLCWWGQQTHCYHYPYFFIAAVQLISPCSSFDLPFKCYWKYKPWLAELFTVSHQFYTTSKAKVLDVAVCMQRSFIINIFNQLKMRELFLICFYLFWVQKMGIHICIPIRRAVYLYVSLVFKCSSFSTCLSVVKVLLQRQD